MITPHPNYRPNPDRAIYVQGPIDQQLVNRLTPDIIRLQSQTRDPITVYIDSPGGRVDLMETLLTLLTASNQDLAHPCRIITVVISRAASAAADMLSSGDYALAFPDSTVLYHGVRLSESRPLTAEVTSLLAQMLRASNDTYAMELARKIEYRFMFRFITSKGYFDDVRQQHPEEEMSDLECFLAFISTQLSEPANKVMQNARQRYGRYNALLDSVLRKFKTNRNYKTAAAFQAFKIKAIVDFEIHNNRKQKNWSFEIDDLRCLTDDYFLLNEYLETSHSERFKTLCSNWGDYLLSSAELEEINNAREEEREEKVVAKVRPLLKPVWSFFVALCHALQQGENDLTARDAFWLGLIDEIIGVELRYRRLLIEYQPDEPAEQSQNETDAKEKTDTAGSSRS